jgi:NADH:ubiquinone oxidoreductase subunit 5 (subunit L)/multisubunit Na+/H+ antiporter MnhA subunit
MQLAELLPLTLGLAWLLPLASFTLIVFFGPRMGKHGFLASYVATGAIGCGFLLSIISLGAWLYEFGTHAPGHESSSHESSAHAAVVGEHVEASKTDVSHGNEHSAHGEHASTPPKAFTGDWYVLGQFGKLKVTISYYIDALTVSMFAMVTLIATCIHIYASGYMHDELHEVTDHEVKLSDGHHLHRPGRFYRFFQYLSLFCFSMLGLVVAGNIFMVFIFWELVGICSYFLIGFYIERKTASNAANKAFIVNRVGDFGMIIGMMALWASLGTFAFGDVDGQPGIFSQVRTKENHYGLQAPDGMVKAAAASEVATIVEEHAGGDPIGAQSEIKSRIPQWRESWDTEKDGNDFGKHSYWLLVVAGLGIFCGCVGKSAQFPLHVWLPDAMEGPTPVSALVHSATMVAAGVYLVGRFYPVFTPEVLLTIAYIGGITLFLAATIAITATDIKRVLAYSTISQLGYMMLSLGVGGWAAGLFHLVTHAFFKSLLFLCSGSVIHACHTNEMPMMGGLRKKMPITAYTMLVGCLAIAGAGIPFAIGPWHLGFSGFYSKDAMLAQLLSFWNTNPTHGAILFAVGAGGAAITAFYMFRLWYMTFAGEPRDHHVYDHAHESPMVMCLPLIILAVFAAGLGGRLPFTGLEVNSLLEQARPAGELGAGRLIEHLVYPNEHASHAAAIHGPAGWIAFGAALAGFTLSTLFYGLRVLNPAEAKQQFLPIYTFLRNKWYFDELYAVIFIRPAHVIAEIASRFDRKGIDWFIDHTAIWTKSIAKIDDAIDRYFVDGFVNLLAAWTWSTGRWMKNVQTGSLRQYVMLIVIGTVALTILIKFSAAAMP